jgi:3-oxoacyl-[acyl-carrier protein] reductase
MDLRIKGRKALVTGAGRGIGRATALALAAEGAIVALNARTEKDLKTAADSLPGAGHTYHAADLTAADGPDRLLASLKSFGDIDIVVHALGGALQIRDPLCGVENWRKLWRLNLEVAVELNERLIPAMRARKWGRIVHVSSVSGGENLGPAPYCAVKSALNAYTRSFGRIYAADGIVVSAVAPGAVMSPGGPWDIVRKEDPARIKEYADKNLPSGEFGTPEETAAVAALLCSENARQFCGCVVAADGGLGRRFT